MCPSSKRLLSTPTRQGRHQSPRLRREVREGLRTGVGSAVWGVEPGCKEAPTMIGVPCQRLPFTAVQPASMLKPAFNMEDTSSLIKGNAYHAISLVLLAQSLDQPFRTKRYALPSSPSWHYHARPLGECSAATMLRGTGPPAAINSVLSVVESARNAARH